MMVVVVVVMMMVMIVTPRDNAVVAVMMVVMMIVILRDLFSVLRLCRSDARVIHLQRIQCIGNWLQKVAITCRWRVLCRFGNGGLCGAHCCQCSRCQCSRSAQTPGYLLIHLFSSCWLQLKTHTHTASAFVPRKEICFFIFSGASGDVNGYSCISLR
jgi:hypothetical protein